MDRLTEQAAYLRGLAEGHEIAPDTPEHKLLLALLEMNAKLADAVDDILTRIEDVEEDTDVLGDMMDQILSSEDEDEDDDEDEDEDDEDEDEEDDDEESFEYQDPATDICTLCCVHCGQKTPVSVLQLLSDGFDTECPACGKPLIRG